jgi:hypothetical protein
MRWDSLAPMPAKLAKSPGLDAARAAMDVFLERLPADVPLLIAEPLATRSVALWRERIEESGRPFMTILWLAHPGRTAAALARRRQFAPEKSLALWLAHLVEFEHATRGTARTIVAEDVFLDDPAGGLKRIAQATRFPPATQAAKAPTIAKQSPNPPPVLGLGSGLDSVLDEGFRKLASTVSGELKRTVDALAAAARAAVQSAIPPWLAQEIEADRARMQTLVDMAAGHAARADRTQRDLAAAPRDARALAAQVEAMRDEQGREREALTAQLESLRGEQANERARLTDELASTRAELARITAALADVPKSEANLRNELTQTQRELNDERTSIAKLTDALETARREADGHQIRFDSARHHLERFALEIEEARATLSAREDLCAKLASEVDGLRVREADLKRERDTLRRERDDAARALERAKRDHEKVSVERESTLHRATAELQAAVEERDKRAIALSEEADRMADAITEAAVRSAGLEEQLEMRTAELAALQIRFDDVITRLRALESRSLVRAAKWLGGEKGPAREGSASD